MTRPSPSSETRPPTPNCGSPRPAAVANFTVASTPRDLRPPERGVEGRRSAVPALQHLARGGRERRREPTRGSVVIVTGGSSSGPSKPARARSARYSRSRSTRSALAAVRHRQGQQGQPQWRRRWWRRLAAVGRWLLDPRPARRPTTVGAAPRHRASAAVTTNRPSDNSAHPFELPARRTKERKRQTIMAKTTKRRPAPEKPVKTRKCVFCSKKGRRRLQGHRAAAHLHQ